MEIVPLRQSFKNSCGPACLEMMVRALGYELSEREIIQQLGGLHSYGVCTVRLAALAASAGFGVKCYSLTKKGRKVIREEANTSLLLNVSASDAGILLAIDPDVLAGKSPSRKVHNIVLCRYGSRFCRYADPSDGMLHKISTKRMIAAWTGAAHRVSAHTVVLEAPPAI